MHGQKNIKTAIEGKYINLMIWKAKGEGIICCFCGQYLLMSDQQNGMMLPKEELCWTA